MTLPGLTVETKRKVSKEFILTTERSERLRQVAEMRQSSENEVVERALDLYFSLALFFDDENERQNWHHLSQAALSRLWDNEQDAKYDDWRELYGVPQG